jgi:hypothetical protein
MPGTADTRDLDSTGPRPHPHAVRFAIPPVLYPVQFLCSFYLVKFLHMSLGNVQLQVPHYHIYVRCIVVLSHIVPTLATEITCSASCTCFIANSMCVTLNAPPQHMSFNVALRMQLCEPQMAPKLPN